MYNGSGDIMDLLNSKYIILEIIPTSLKRETGEVVQLSALKLDGIKLIDRFDYRLNEEKVPIHDFIDMCSYDKESFTYVSDTDTILEEFKNWIQDYPLLIIDNEYTKNYLSSIPNPKESIFKYLDILNDDKAIDKMISKYQLEPSNYIADLLYEALIQEL